MTTPALTERDLGFMDWLRSRGAMTLAEAIANGACLALDTDERGLQYALNKLHRHKLLHITVRRCRRHYAGFGSHNAYVRVYRINDSQGDANA